MLLEHVNLTVSDLDRSVAFYCGLLDVDVRWRRDPDSPDTPAAHLGDERGYVALFQARHGEAIPASDYGRVGFNHLGFIVADLDAKVAWLREQGVDVREPEPYPPGRRVYFDDFDGIEVELVEYDN